MGEMNGMLYWECKEGEEQTGVLNEEPDTVPAAAIFTARKRSRGEQAGRSGWKGPGTLWIADTNEEPYRKK